MEQILVNYSLIIFVLILIFFSHKIGEQSEFIKNKFFHHIYQCIYQGFSSILFLQPIQDPIGKLQNFADDIGYEKNLTFQDTHKMSNFCHTNTFNTVCCHSVTTSDRHIRHFMKPVTKFQCTLFQHEYCLEGLILLRYF